jgi:flagellar motor protein MotB
MVSRRTQLLIISAALSCLLYSCVSQRKVTTTKTDLKAADSVLVIQKKSLGDLDQLRRAKYEQNEMDDTSNARINSYINRTQAEIDKMNAENTIRIGESVVNRKDWENLLKTLSYARSSSKKISDKILFLSDLINQNTVVKIDQDVLFEPGKYVVTPAMVSGITALFEPAALAIDQFTRKYPDFPLSLVITAKGYADATTISEGSTLYADLKKRMALSGVEPDNKALNKELSNARAQQVIELFKKFAAERAGSQGYLKNVLYLHEGKGENLPNPKISDYKVDDPRRRVVYLFWSVFPE